jgi:hypothetical protein
MAIGRSDKRQSQATARFTSRLTQRPITSRSDKSNAAKCDSIADAISCTLLQSSGVGSVVVESQCMNPGRKV